MHLVDGWEGSQLSWVLLHLRVLSMASYGRGIAEVLFISATFIWVAVFGVRMLWRASHQMSN